MILSLWFICCKYNKQQIRPKAALIVNPYKSWRKNTKIEFKLCKSHPKNPEKEICVYGVFSAIISQYDAVSHLSAPTWALSSRSTLFFSANFPGNGVTVLVLIFSDHWEGQIPSLIWLKDLNTPHFFKRIFFLHGPFLKSLLNLLQSCFCFMCWFFGPEASGILAPWPGMDPTPPAL